jgi:hypothetical protein
MKSFALEVLIRLILSWLYQFMLVTGKIYSDISTHWFSKVYRNDRILTSLTDLADHHNFGRHRKLFAVDVLIWFTLLASGYSMPLTDKIRMKALFLNALIVFVAWQLVVANPQSWSLKWYGRSMSSDDGLIESSIYESQRWPYWQARSNEKTDQEKDGQDSDILLHIQRLIRTMEGAILRR